MEGAATTTMESVISTVSSIVTAAIGWMGDYVSAITSNPLILLFVCLPLVGLGIGLIKRMVSL